MCEMLVGNLSEVFKYPLTCNLSQMFAFCGAKILTLDRWRKAVQALVMEMKLPALYPKPKSHQLLYLLSVFHTILNDIFIGRK